MYKTTLILSVLLLFVFITGKAQKNNYVYYDSLTYKLYVDKDYKNLIKKGKEALDSGLDYYYLRMRIGIALYEQHKYRAAAPHFQKAVSFYDNDVAREYLYYAYLWGGNRLQALKVTDGMSAALRQKLHIKEEGLIGTNIEMATLSQAEDFPKDFDFPLDKGEGEQIVPTNFFSLALDISHRAGKNAAMTHMFTYLHKGNDKYTFVDNEDTYDTDFNTSQFQYYIGSAISAGDTWDIILGGQLSATAVPVYVEYATRRMGGSQYAKSYDWEYDYALSASFLKNFSRASFEAEFALTYINTSFNFQPSGIIRFYPLANLNLYTQSQFGYQTGDSDGKFFQQQKLGFKVAKHLWVEANYFTGSLSGFTLNNGALLFNGLEEVDQMAGGQLIIPGGSKFTMTLGYQNRVQSNYFISFDDDIKSNKLELNYSLIYIMLSWTL
ncbi:MAG: hypothetical protein GXO47_12060 [Chlorobi bacterium]|nr:hypothetical protein [Chlorobiota bacterium]